MKKDSNHNQQIDFIKHLAKIAKDLDLAEIDFKEKDLNIKINRISNNTSFNFNSNPAPQYTQAQALTPSNLPQAKTEEQKSETDYSKHSGALLSPMVGVIYTAPNVDAKDFVSVGDSVKQGDTLLLIEAMKVFNPIKANRDGKISKILVKANQAVEFNQALIIIE